MAEPGPFLCLLVLVCTTLCAFATESNPEGEEKPGSDEKLTAEDLESLLKLSAEMLKALGDKPAAAPIGEVPSKEEPAVHGSSSTQSPPPHPAPQSPPPPSPGAPNVDPLIGLVNTFLPILLQGLNQQPPPSPPQQQNVPPPAAAPGQQTQQQNVPPPAAAPGQQTQQQNVPLPAAAPGQQTQQQNVPPPAAAPGQQTQHASPPPVGQKQEGFEQFLPIIQMLIAMVTKDGAVDLSKSLPMLMQFFAIFLNAQNPQNMQQPQWAQPAWPAQSPPQVQPPQAAPIVAVQTQVPAPKREKPAAEDDEDRPLMDFFPKSIRPHLMVHPVDEFLRRVKGSDVEQLVGVLSKWAKWRSVEDVIIAVKKGAPKIYKVSFDLGVPLGYNFLLVYQLLGVDGKAKLDEIYSDLEAVMDKARLFLAKLPTETKGNIISAVQANSAPLASLLSEVLNSNVVKLMMEETLQREKDLRDLAMLEELDLDELAEEIQIPNMREAHREL